MKALLLLFSLVISSAAQDLTGTWRLVSGGEWRPNGEILYPYGKKPDGLLIYDAAGNVSLQIHFDGKAANGETSLAYYGTYKLDKTTGTVTHQVAASTRESERGSAQMCFVTIEGNRLTLGLLPQRVDGEMRLRSLTLERIAK
jgi:hypothetical protein